MRTIAILLSLVAFSAIAQQPDAPAAQPTPSLMPAPVEPAPQTPPPAVMPPPSATGPAESAGERAVRYSRFSAGSGGRLLAVTQGLAGALGGAFLGYASGYKEGDEENQAARSRLYTGLVVGGLMMGTAGVLYQYYVPVERNESFLVAGAATTAFITGVTLVALMDADPVPGSLLMIGTMEAGIVSVLALTHGGGDVSNGDAVLVGMSSLYAAVLTGLTQGIIHESGSGKTNFYPTLISPTVGMAVGGLLAMALELDAKRLTRLTLIPLGVSMAMLGLGAVFADGVTVPLTSMAGLATSFALTLLLTSDPGVPTEQEGLRRADLQVMPVPMVMAAGRDNSSLAAGPGLFMRF